MIWMEVLVFSPQNYNRSYCEFWEISLLLDIIQCNSNEMGFPRCSAKRLQKKALDIACFYTFNMESTMECELPSIFIDIVWPVNRVKNSKQSELIGRHTGKEKRFLRKKKLILDQ